MSVASARWGFYPTIYGGSSSFCDARCSSPRVRLCPATLERGTTLIRTLQELFGLLLPLYAKNSKSQPPPDLRKRSALNVSCSHLLCWLLAAMEAAMAKCWSVSTCYCNTHRLERQMQTALPRSAKRAALWSGRLFLGNIKRYFVLRRRPVLRAFQVVP